MKKLLFCALFLTSTAQAFTITPETIQLNGGFDRDIKDDTFELLKQRPVGSTVDIYIDSPGGDTGLASEIIGRMRALNTKCAANRAYSAAFSVFQACTVRNHKQDSQLMTHQHTTELLGSRRLPALLTHQIATAMMLSQVWFITNDAMRMRISPDLYLKKIETGDWNMVGSREININNASDNEVDVTCSADTTGKTLKYKYRQAYVELSMCPIDRSLVFSGDASDTKVLKKMFEIKDLKKK